MRKLCAPIRPASTSALALAALVTASCVLVDNPSYCDTSADCADPARSYCDVEGMSGGVRNRCIPEPACSTSECTADAPVCDSERGGCVGCRSDNDCARFAEAGVCGPSGACVSCRTHADCPSDACDLFRYECVPEADVHHVVSGASSAGECTRDAPCGDLRYTVSLSSSTRSVIRMAAGEYEGPVVVGSGSVWLLADPGAIVVPGAGDVDPRETFVIEPGAQLLLDQLIVAGSGSVSKSAAIRCQGNPSEGETRVRLHRSRVTRAGNAAVESYGCLLEVTQSMLTRNGGGILAVGGRLEVLQSVLSENATEALFVAGVALKVRNNVVWGNGSSSSTGSTAVFLSSVPADSSFDHNTVVGNASPDALPAVFCQGAQGDLTLTNNIIYDNGNGPPADGCLHRFSLIGPDPVEGPGNRNEEPAFASSSTGDLHLAPLSPGIDQAESSNVNNDIDGQVRPQGSGPDMGADEWFPE